MGSGCLDRPIDRIEPRTTSTVVERLTQSGVDKIDLLLTIDNSASMADKQAILAEAVPDLVERLVNPNCVDPETGAAIPDQPANPTQDCPPIGERRSEREFPPIQDINVGVISSSLGGLTAAVCDGVSNPAVGANDKGHLLTRTPSGEDPTYENLGFLAWDPAGNKKSPPGDGDVSTFSGKLRDLVVGVDQTGCGFEMPLESTLRFLVDPEPYDTLLRDDGRLIENGIDQMVLQQRKDFLRPNSLLAIIVLSDENDCSVDVDGAGYLTFEESTFYKSTAVCDVDPNDVCCTSCALPLPEGCQRDEARCGPNQETASAARWRAEATAPDDPRGLRCYNQKARYGVSFLYPIERYVNAFTRANIDPGSRTYAAEPGKGVANPIFSDLSGVGGAIRDPGLVFVAGIVGVPWQAIARRGDSGVPDLSLGFKTFNELASDPNIFAALVGEPDANIPPSDPLMRESVAKRSGQSTLVPGVSLPGVVGQDNGVNGWDRNVLKGNDLQYVCKFALAGADPNSVDDDPDCKGEQCGSQPTCDNPLCDPSDLSQQIYAKAYPGLRELAWLRGMQDQGIFASICPAEVVDKGSKTYGYRPAVGAIIDRLAEELGGQCLPRKLIPDDEGNVPCLVLEAVASAGGGSCDESQGRRAIPEDDARFNAVKAAQSDPFANPAWDTFCEIVQLSGQPRAQCQNDASVSGVNGWCYIDATTVPVTGNPELVAQCPENEKRIVRFVGEGEPQPGGTVFITCTGE
jgi:hypothetical protein